MRCLKPYLGSGRMAFPCGDCPSCRANRRRIWTHRMMLESMQHEYSSFVTLTYGDANLPNDGSLVPEHLTLWLKRLRQVLNPVKVRYFAVGEYGDRSFRPHYHAAVFGLSGCAVSFKRGECSCRSCSVVRETWGYGHVMVGELTSRSAQYITGYVAKKMTRPDHPMLDGRVAEFARMSLRPGIGAGAVPDVASVMMQFKLEQKMVDVPVALRHGGSELPLGRYLRRLLRLQCGLDENAPQAVIDALKSGLLPVYTCAAAIAPRLDQSVYRKELVRQAIELENEQYGRNVAARMKRRSKL